MVAVTRNKTKSTLRIVVSLMAGALLLAGTGLADAKDGKSKPSQGASFRQEGTQRDHDGDHRDRDEHKKHRKHKDKDKKCGGKKKCPTPKPFPIHGGNPPVSSPTGSGNPGDRSF